MTTFGEISRALAARGGEPSTFTSGVGLTLQERRKDRDRPLDEEHTLSPVALTVMSYLSIGEKTAPVISPSPNGLSIIVPTASDYAASCLAVGVGREGGEMVAALAAAPWFSHLLEGAVGPLGGSGREADNVMADVLGRMRGPHVVSVALPRRPDWSEVEAACAVGRAISQRGAFAVGTASQPSPAAMERLGKAFDCVIEGDGGLHHHWYPIRTVTEPADGRMICYDLYDVCALWAGRIGTFGVVVPAADALHVEVSAETESLAEVDRLATTVAARLKEPERLCLLNVVAGARPGATAVSSWSDPKIRKERVP